MSRSALLLSAALLLSCTPSPPPEPEPTIDADEDGWPEELDCDDALAQVFPGSQEVCDGLDDDCDGLIDEDAIDAPPWYGDADGDGHGSDHFVVFACEAPADHVPLADDCDDLDESAWPGAEETCDGEDDDCDGDIDEDGATGAHDWFFDGDGDGWGADQAPVAACEAPWGHVANAGDCDDLDPAWNPGAAESDCADPNDYNCDGSVGWEDADGDGFAACEDCDDGDASVSPDGEESCDGVDQDCDGVADGSAVDAPEWHADADGDGWGGTSLVLVQCLAPAGWLLDASDCDDLDPSSNPDGTEVCDGADNDCDSDVDEGVGLTWWVDGDGDGYGDPGGPIVACTAPPGASANPDDCDDVSAVTSPASYEICDGIDNDCDTLTDEADAINTTTWYRDWDGDGYGGPGQVTQACDEPAGFAATGGDCDDSDPGVGPDAVELCNGADDDCDGDVDEDDAADASTWYVDDDGDGWGVNTWTAVACAAPWGFADNSLDCDDSDPASTIISGDADCDGAVAAADCDDSDAASTVVAGDADCDGTATALDCDDTDPASTVLADDADCDGWLPPADCDDTDPLIHPGAPEIAGDGVDNDCDGAVDPVNFSGVVELPAAGTVDGYAHGEWSALNNGGRTATRVVLTQGCSNPQISLFQHATADTSIYGSYYVMDSAGTVLGYSAYQTYSGCNDCWLPHPGRLSLSMSAGAVYWLAFQNGVGHGDMSGPSIFLDSNARTVGIATFDAPRADMPGNDTRGIPGAAVSWQNRWRIDCQ